MYHAGREGSSPAGSGWQPCLWHYQLCERFWHAALSCRAKVDPIVHMQCTSARATPFVPKGVHEVALKRIGPYLKGNCDKGLVHDPCDSLRLDCYPNANFEGLWGYEHPQETHCARSQMSFVICLLGCPVLWKSSLQTEISLSTIEAEYVALSTSCEDLFPIIDLVRELGGCLGLPVMPNSNLHVRVHEENVSVFTRAMAVP